MTEETPAATEADVPSEGDERPGESESERRRRRRGRRGGRRRRREPGEAAAAEGRPEGEVADKGEPAAVNIEIVDMPPPETSERLQETLATEPLAAASDAVALQEAPIAESGEALPEAKSPPDAAPPVERAPIGAEPEATRPVEPVAAETIELVPEAATPANLPQPRLVSERPTCM